MMLSQSGPLLRTRFGKPLARSALLLVALMPVVAGCGEDGPTANPNAQPSEVVQTLAITLDSAASPQTYELERGKLTYLNVTSPEAGELSVSGYNASARVEAGKSNSLIFSANNKGTFDLLFRGGGGERTVAKLRFS
jgi:predicted small lipoprotein YifL